MFKIKLLYLFITLILASSVRGQIVINEAVSTNLIYADQFGEYEDWIELKNIGTQTIDLHEYALSDDPANPEKWEFSSGSLAPGALLIIFSSGKDIQGAISHTNFKLDGNGEILILSKDGNIEQNLWISDMPKGFSFARTGNGNYRYSAYPTPGTDNDLLETYSFITPAPEINTPSGFYETDVTVNIQTQTAQGVIRYTLDGSEPNENSPVYSGNIQIGNIESLPNGISIIPTNPGFNYPIGSYTAAVADSRGWLPPYTNQFKTRVLRARCFAPDARAGRITTATYIITPQKENRFAIPVLSLVSDTVHLFSPTLGIYVVGANPANPNYDQTGRNWERPLNFTLFNKTGMPILEADAGMRINGGGGRKAPQKSLRIYFRSEYGQSPLDFPLLFENSETIFDNLLIRNGGHRPDCIPRDHLAVKLVHGLRNSDNSGSMPVTVLLNGEYWGIQFLKHRIDEHYYINKYKLKENEFSILQLKGKRYYGAASDSVHYAQLVNLAYFSDLNQGTNYKDVCEKMDVNNYMDYIITEVYLRNGDWPDNNVRFWRKSTNGFVPNAPAGHDGRWRWMLYDFDATFGSSCAVVSPNVNSILTATDNSINLEQYTRLLRGLLTSNEFKKDFINRFADLLNTTYSSPLVLSKVNLVDAEMTGSMLEYVNRWQYPSFATTLVDRDDEVPSLGQWNYTILGLRNYAKQRAFFQREHILSFFGLQDSCTVNLNVDVPGQGIIKINTIFIDSITEGISAQPYPWKGIYFKNVPIKLKAIARPGFQFVKWIETGDTLAEITVALDTNQVTLTAQFEPDPNYNALLGIKFNEVQASNSKTIFDLNNESDDWIELYNPSSSEIDLNGYYLSNDASNPQKFKITATGNEMKIPPFGYKLFWADQQISQGSDHLNFKISANGEILSLYSPDGISLVDTISFAQQWQDFSYGSYPNGAIDKIFFYAPTPRESNVLSGLDESNLNENNDLNVFPNPLNGNTLQFSEAMSGILFDINGKMLARFQNKNQLDVSGFENGTYFLQNDKGKTTKIVILR